jgi:hypothetical protein
MCPTRYGSCGSCCKRLSCHVVLLTTCLSVQSYGIKVGYGSGGPNNQPKPEPDTRKSSGCC